MKPSTNLRKDPLRLGIYLVAVVFLVGLVESAVFAIKEGGYILEGAFAVLLTLALTFVVQAPVAFGGVALVRWMGRSWGTWQSIDHLIALVPWCSWALLYLLVPSQKSFVNILLEGVLVGCAAPLSALLKLAVTRMVPPSWSTGLSFGLGTVLAFGLWKFVPFIGE